jgi:hypothetical protein
MTFPSDLDLSWGPVKEPGPWRLSAVLTVLSVVLAFCLSSYMLALIGIDYETPGGAQWQKLSPATYMAALALAVLAMERGPVFLLNDIVARQKGTLALLAACAFLLIYIITVRPMPLTSIIDTFIFPCILLVLMTRLSEQVLRPLSIFLHIFMMVNAVIGIAEFTMAFRITPMILPEDVPPDWRSTALMGHPLMNAMATGSYAVALIAGGGRDMPAPLRYLSLGLQVASLPVFGGRAATAAVVAFLAVWAAWNLLQFLRGVAAPRSMVTAMSFAVPLLAMGVGTLVASGFLDKFLNRFIRDDGSAASRLIMFELMGRLSNEELIYGPDPDYVGTLQRVYGIQYGIESFWVAFVAYYGFIVSIPIFIGLLLFMNDIVKHTSSRTWWVMLYFLMVASTSLSMAGKGTMVATIAVSMVI